MASYPLIKKPDLGNTIFIKNLDKAIDNKALFDIFSAFGNILSCKVATDETGESRGFGYVHFEKQEDAERSIDKVNGMSLNEKIVFVGTFISKKERQATGQGRIIFNNLYVKNFGSEWTEQQFHELFSQYGEILSIKIMKGDNGIGQGFGFCSFTKAESAMDAQEQLHQKHQIPTGEILYVQRAQRRREREGELKRKFEIVKQEKRQETKGVNLFVKNLEDEITDELLRTHFVPYGNITSCKVMRDETGHSKGFGFVCYATPEEATKAVTELNGKIIITKPLYVAIAQRKEERRALLTQQFVNRQMTHISRQNSQHLASGMMPAAATLMPYGLNFSANIPRAYNPALRLPAPRGAYGQSLQQMIYTPNAGAPRPNMHPMSMMLHQQQMMQGPPQQPKDMSTKPINITHLTSADPKQQKQILGETLFPIIYRKYPQQAGKITGMLLELEISELLFLLDSGEQLNAKMEEAFEVLQKHQQVNVPSVGRDRFPLRQRSCSSERLSDRGSLAKSRPVSSSTRDLSQNSILNNSFQNRNAEARAKNKFDTRRQFRELVLQTSKRDESIEQRNSLWEAKRKALVCPTRWKCSRRSIPNYEDYCLRPKTADNARDEMRKSNFQEKLYDQYVPLKAGNGKEFENDTVIQPPVTSLRKPRIGPVKKTEVSVNEKHNLNMEIILDELRSMNPSKQKETLGAIIFPTIHSLYPEQATQICETMLLTFGVEEMIQMFQSRETLKSRIKIIKENLSNHPLNLGHNKDRIESKYRTSVLIETDVCMGIRTVEDKIYDTARREYPNEANLIVGLITEKRSKDQLQLLASSETLLEHEVEKARAKIRILETPVCKNYL